MSQTPRSRVYRGATREDAERAYYADARAKADEGYVPASESWSGSLDQQVLTVGYVHAPDRVPALLAALAEPVPATPAPEVPTPPSARVEGAPAKLTPSATAAAEAALGPAALAPTLTKLLGAASRVSQAVVRRVRVAPAVSRRLAMGVIGMVVLVSLGVAVWQSGILGSPNATGGEAASVPAPGEIWFGTSYDRSTFGVSGQTDSIGSGSSVAVVAHLPTTIDSGKAFIRLSLNGTLAGSEVLVLHASASLFGMTVGPFQEPGTYLYEVTDLGTHVLASGSLTVHG